MKKLKWTAEQDDLLRAVYEHERSSVVDQRRLVAVFEDRDRVVKMWRDAGVPCLQVAPGEF